MKRNTIILLSAPLFALCIISSASALGIGAYATIQGGFEKWNAGLGSTNNFHYGGGLLLDTAVAKNTLFGYRLKLGFESFHMEREKAGPDGYRFGATNTFGFGIYRNNTSRFWLGPQFGLKYFIAEEHWREAFGSPAKRKYHCFGMDLGLAIGVNFHIGKIFTIGLEGGLGAVLNLGKFRVREGVLAHNRDAVGIGAEAHLSIAFIFRIHDTFRGR